MPTIPTAYYRIESETGALVVNVLGEHLDTVLRELRHDGWGRLYVYLLTERG